MKANKLMATLVVSALAVGMGIPALAADANWAPAPSTAIKMTTSLLEDGTSTDIMKLVDDQIEATMATALEGGKAFELPEGAVAMTAVTLTESIAADGEGSDFVPVEEGAMHAIETTMAQSIEAN